MVSKPHLVPIIRDGATVGYRVYSARIAPFNTRIFRGYIWL